MKNAQKYFGSLLFWLFWPVGFIFFRSTHRTRVLLVADNKILFVHNLISRNQLCLPGGGVHSNEDPLAAAIRELKEETGIIISPKSLHLIYANKLVSEVGIKYSISSYYANLALPLPIKTQPLELISAEWLDWEELLDTYLISKTTNDILHAWIENQHLVD